MPSGADIIGGFPQATPKTWWASPFNIGDLCFIKAIELTGVVRAVRFTPRLEYSVTYWFDAERRELWLDPDELEPKR